MTASYMPGAEREQLAKDLAQRFAARRYTGSEATKQTFCSLASTLPPVHFHGHVRADYHPQQNDMLFARGEELKAMEVFELDLQQSRPAVVLIGFISGRRWRLRRPTSRRASCFMVVENSS
ncbi:hypothetical protein EDB80DRAFT_871543 [Ilyonectria destructans]|nr:hypothetical protein EDB80DRAFT_871543 [Ilyonectria destructans]